MIIDYGTKKLIVKIVYFGPAMAGKTTTLYHLFGQFGKKDTIQSIETQEGRTLFFDIGNIVVKKGAWNIYINIWSATGQNFYAGTRPTVLEGADAIIFVADSEQGLIQDNINSWDELLEMFESKKEIPIVVALNKRDKPEAIPLNEFKDQLNITDSVEIFETIATTGENVMECFKLVLRKTLNTPIISA